MKHIIVGTAGHIDHGKSTLIKALTGIDPDRLKEEKERGITIDIGFANLELEEDIHIGFVDVPGHERFIKNMLAGIGGIDAVLLVVAADESIMPQTREHLDICSLLEISTGAVVITKSDLVDQDILDLVRLELQEYLQSSFLRNAPMIPVSAMSGSGLEQLKAALHQMAQTVPAKNTHAIFRLPIDRCFTLHGFGTVVTGTLVSGRINKDAEVEIYPTGKKSRIRSIQVHGQTVDNASAGQRTALNLQGIEVAEIQRGMELSVAARFQPAAAVDTMLHLLESSPASLRNRARVRFHHGTSEIMATLNPINTREILPGQTAYARIILEHPILAVTGDKFILRRTSPMVTIGGGTILDNRPPARIRKNLEGTVEFLKAMQSLNLKEIILQLAKRNGIAGTDEDQILSRTLVQQCTLREILDDLARANRLKLLSKTPFQAMDTEAFEQLCRRTLEVIGQFHRDEPLSPGISKEQLYSAIFRSSPQTSFKAVMDHLSAQGRIIVEQDRVRLHGRAVTLNQEELSAKQQIEEAFLKGGWKVPDLEEVLSGLPVPKDQAKRLVLLLTKEKKLIKLSESLFFHADPIAQLKKLLAEYKKKSDRIDVGAFKNLTDISRKYAIPLLEYLDRERITRRVGDSRLIL